MKTINTLVKDIHEVIQTGGGWDETLSLYTAEEFTKLFDSRLGSEQREFTPSLRLSSLGTPCKRKLWYSVNKHDAGESLSSSTLFKFLYGDLLEQMLISLAMAAGHDVRGMQDRLDCEGIKGHRDCVIDGITVDIKSASPYAFQKFKSGGLRDDDPFGYISQLSSYVYAGRNHEVPSHPSLGAFLVVNKVSGEICLDMYDFGPELDRKAEEVAEIKAIVNDTETVPPRGFEDIPDGKSGNMKLGVQCSYCGFKDTCWDGLRTFIYSTGPKFLTTVAKEPNVREVT